MEVNFFTKFDKRWVVIKKGLAGLTKILHLRVLQAFETFEPSFILLGNKNVGNVNYDVSMAPTTKLKKAQSSKWIKKHVFK